MAKRRRKKRKGLTEPSIRVSFVNGQLQVVFREGINKDRRRVKKMKVQQLQPKSLHLRVGNLKARVPVQAGAAVAVAGGNDLSGRDR